MYSTMRSVRAGIVKKGFTLSSDGMIGLSPRAAVAEPFACQGFVNRPPRRIDLFAPALLGLSACR